MTNPHVEVCVDPRRGENSVGGGDFLCGSDGFASGQRAKILVLLNALVEFAQEFAAITRVILPRIFAVEKEADGQRLLAGHAFAKKAQATVEVGGSGFGVHTAVNETDQIGKMVIAKQPVNGSS